MLTYIKKILEAKVYDVAIETPIDKMNFLSNSLKNNIYSKREDLQPVFSFKIRGAYNKIAKLSQEEKTRGIIAASAGNHAQGVALSASRLGIKSVIVMPLTTPEIKIRSVKRLGGEVVLYGDNFDAAYEYSQKLMEEKGYTYIHPYDDPDVIAGQGTAGMEICRQTSDNIDAVFVPVGGGGLLAGISVYLKYLRPGTKIFAVEAEESACLAAAMSKNKRVLLNTVGGFADGIAVKQIGKETFNIIKENIDGVITVSNDEICAAIKEIFEDTRIVAEPAGAAALAGLKKYIKKNKIKEQNLLHIISGANMNFDRLRYVSERTEIGENREMILGVTIPECPGSFKTFCEIIGKNNITEFNYRYSNANDAQVFVGIQISPNSNEREKLISRLRVNGYSAYDFSENELAKMHIRYMVGGTAAGIKNEEIYRFEFPERQGALLDLLNKLGKKWNISMFHYRNHGSAYGRVFIGLQIPPFEKKDFKLFLKNTGLSFSEENGNKAYQMFLGAGY